MSSKAAKRFIKSGRGGSNSSSSTAPGATTAMGAGSIASRSGGLVNKIDLGNPGASGSKKQQQYRQPQQHLDAVNLVAGKSSDGTTVTASDLALLLQHAASSRAVADAQTNLNATGGVSVSASGDSNTSSDDVADRTSGDTNSDSNTDSEGIVSSLSAESKKQDRHHHHHHASPEQMMIIQQHHHLRHVSESGNAGSESDESLSSAPETNSNGNNNNGNNSTEVMAATKKKMMGSIEYTKAVPKKSKSERKRKQSQQQGQGSEQESSNPEARAGGVTVSGTYKDPQGGRGGISSSEVANSAITAASLMMQMDSSGPSFGGDVRTDADGRGGSSLFGPPPSKKLKSNSRNEVISSSNATEPSSVNSGFDNGNGSHRNSHRRNRGDQLMSLHPHNHENNHANSHHHLITGSTRTSSATTAVMAVPATLNNSSAADLCIEDELLDLNSGLATMEGQLVVNPGMAEDEARAAAKKEYNRRNAARARVRSKGRVQDLQRRVDGLTKRIEELQRANEVLKAQVDVLTSQNRDLVRNRDHSAIASTSRTCAGGDASRQSTPPPPPPPLSTAMSTTAMSPSPQVFPNDANQVLMGLFGNAGSAPNHHRQPPAGGLDVSALASQIIDTLFKLQQTPQQVLPQLAPRVSAFSSPPAPTTAPPPPPAQQVPQQQQPFSPSNDIFAQLQTLLGPGNHTPANVQDLLSSLHKSQQMPQPVLAQSQQDPPRTLPSSYDARFSASSGKHDRSNRSAAGHYNSNGSLTSSSIHTSQQPQQSLQPIQPHPQHGRHETQQQQQAGQQNYQGSSAATPAPQSMQQQQQMQQLANGNNNNTLEHWLNLLQGGSSGSNLMSLFGSFQAPNSTSQQMQQSMQIQPHYNMPTASATITGVGVTNIASNNSSASAGSTTASHGNSSGSSSGTAPAPQHVPASSSMAVTNAGGGNSTDLPNIQNLLQGLSPQAIYSLLRESGGGMTGTGNGTGGN